MFLWSIIFLTLTSLFTNAHAADYDLTSTSDEQDIKDRNYYFDNQKDNFFKDMPEEMQKKILTIAILTKPTAAGRLSFVCKKWNEYVNDETTTQAIVEYMQEHTMDIFTLNTAGRRKHYPSDDIEIPMLRQTSHSDLGIMLVCPLMFGLTISTVGVLVSHDLKFFIATGIGAAWTVFTRATCGSYIMNKIYPDSGWK